MAPRGRASLSVVDLLDAYLAGRFDEVVRTLEGDVDFNEVLQAAAPGRPRPGSPPRPLTHAHGANSPPPPSRSRRPAPGSGTSGSGRSSSRYVLGAKPDECYEPLNVLSWKAPPLLIEWACERFRQDETPRPIERWWQLAAVAVAQRSEDAQFMVGDPRIGEGVAAGEIGNLQDEIKHLDHVVPRFPGEMRFLLAQGIARDREWTDDALSVYGALRNDPDVGGEAMMRLGAMQLRQRRPAEALKSFDARAQL